MIVTLPSTGLSNAAASRSKHWIKLITGVDTSKSDGYAFIGTFRHFEGAVEVAEGAWFLAYIENRRGSGQLTSREVTLYRAIDNDLNVVREWNLDGSAGWALRVRDEIAQLMAEAEQPSEASLLAEREQLVARIEAIDADLAKIRVGS